MNDTLNPYTTVFEINDNTNQEKVYKNTINSVIPENMTSISFVELEYFIAGSVTELFTEVFGGSNRLSDINVRNQVKQALNEFIKNFQDKDNVASRRFSKPSLTENDDYSCLLEWNFENFRIGISFEKEEKESFYFYVSRDDSIGKFESYTRKINGDLELIISLIANFVIQNT
jgi:hypothetical protein